jgi:hypothetical protein
VTCLVAHCAKLSTVRTKTNKGKVSAVKGTKTEGRDDAMAKRNHKQESKAIQAMKQCGRAAQAA